MSIGRALQKLSISVFHGGWNLPIWVGIEQGFFEQQALDLEVHYTPNSHRIVEGFYHDHYPIILLSADNVIAYQANHAEFDIKGTRDAKIFLGGDNGFLFPVTAPTITNVSELKGKIVGVDKKDTGFAFVLYAWLESHGVKINEVEIREMGSTYNRFQSLLKGECDVTLLRTPFERIAKSQKGCNVFALENFHYQGTVGVVKNSFLQNNPDCVRRFKAGYLEGLEWLKQHPGQAKLILQKYCTELPDGLVDDAFQCIKSGLHSEGKPDYNGLQAVLELRNKFCPRINSSRGLVELSIADMIADL